MPDVTLVCTDCMEEIHIKNSIRAFDRCLQLCDFGAVKFLTDKDIDYPHKVATMPLPSLVHYSIFCLKELPKYIDTKYALIVQNDGWILNADAWDNKFYEYDYIGPLFNQYDIQGVGGFSFRSKALMNKVSAMWPAWDVNNTDAFQRRVGCYEDGAIAMLLRPDLERQGFKFATLEDAGRFAQGGNPNNQFWVERPFGFHGSWRAIDQTTGKVSSQIKHDGFVPQPI